MGIAMETLYERLIYDGNADFLKLARAYLVDNSTKGKRE
jgi:hypothetical protein